MVDKFWERVRQVRRQVGLSQAEFGKKIGISLPSVVRMEQDGASVPRADLVVKIAELFACDLTWLLTGKQGVASNAVPVLRSIRQDGGEATLGCLAIPEVEGGATAIKITGDDAVPSILPGDYVVLAKETPVNGDLVVFESQWGEARARRLVIDDNVRRLVAEMQNVPDKIVDETVKVVGKIMLIVRCIAT